MSFNLHQDRGGGTPQLGWRSGWAWAQLGQKAPGGNLTRGLQSGLGVGASAGGCHKSPGATKKPAALGASGTG